MGSVVDWIECPDCGSEAHDDFYYKTGEEFINCPSCGYSRRFYIRNAEELREELGSVPDYVLEEEHGCGAYRLRALGNIAYECGAFTTPDSIEAFISHVEANKDALVHAEYTTFVDGVLDKVVLIQEGPNAIEEELKQ